MANGSRKSQGRSRRGRGRRVRRNRSHRMRGGVAPVGYSNPGPMNLNLAQGQQFAEFHKNQHGGAVFSGGPYPGSVTDSGLPADLRASAALLPLDRAFADIRGLSDQTGGKRKRKGSRKGSRKGRTGSRKGRKGSRKSRKGSRKSRKGSRKGRKSSRKMRGGLYRWGGGALGFMPVADSTKMLISPQQQLQAGLNPEWKLAENPMSFAPRN